MQSNKDDQTLVLELKAGNEDAFAEIYRRYYTRMHLEANYMLKDKIAAEDVVQDVFTNLWRIKSELPANVMLKLYLTSATRNRCMSNFRGTALFDRYIQYQKGTLTIVTPEPAFNKHRNDLILAAIKQLPPEQRKVLELRYYYEFSHKEIAAATGKEIQNIKNLLNAAIRTLRKKLIFLEIN